MAAACPSAPVAGAKPIELAGPEDAITTCVIRLALTASGMVKTVLTGVQPADLKVRERALLSPVGRGYCGSRTKSL